MTEVSAPPPMTARFATALRATKADFVSTYDDQTGDDKTIIVQQGAATLDSAGFPDWPRNIGSGEAALHEAVIETFLGHEAAATALSDNEPFVSAWLPLAQWMNATVRRQLAEHDVALDGDAYITASLTATAELEGVAHMDDDTFTPADSVGMVAIIGDLAGPRVATGTLAHGPLRPMSQVLFTDDQLDAFAADAVGHHRAEANELVVFPQFGQLHAGPAAHHVGGLAPTRQLLVMRARVRT